MFICAKCASKSLSKRAKEYPWLVSGGRCELCGKSSACLDVPSSADWAWKSTAAEDKLSSSSG